ncbi:unnamed protein product [Effrenium voratum]|nr:unnamed protein product [Effrenium voratum]CAJ1418909.1 unnamed protein product [Effrenium voratum]
MQPPRLCSWRLHRHGDSFCSYAVRVPEAGENQSNSTGLLEAILDEAEASHTTMASVLGVGGILAALCVVALAWKVFKWLTGPRKTPAPLLADTELNEGDPVNGADQSNALWMGGSGPSRELRLMPQTSAGFTQF